MSDSLGGLRKDLTQVRELLQEGAFLSFSHVQRQRLAQQARELLEKLDGLAEEFLTVGLLGGTGVGKSSLMNALAGSEISSSSHRRPHTDLVLIYRHEDAELPPVLRRLTTEGQGRSLWHEIVHRADDVRQILLCDLPDFDSLLGEHQSRVMDFLEHLDTVVWVTSPEKYADARFYQFLQQTPKARQNFSFVLNKVDLLFHGHPPDSGYDRLSKVTGLLQRHLAEHGLSHPLVYAVSAEEILKGAPPSPWSQFAGFRHHIFQKREAKEVTAIKAANLDVEVQQLVAALDREVSSLEAFHAALGEFARELGAEREDWRRSGAHAISHCLEAHFTRESSALLLDLTPLVGPGHAIAAIAREYELKSRRTDDRSVLSGLFGDTGPMSTLQGHFKRVEDRIVHRLMREGLTSGHIHHFQEAIQAEHAWRELQERMRTFIELRLAHRESTVSRWFVWKQHLTYFLILILFLFSMGGAPPWSGLLRDPSWSNAAQLVFGGIGTVFSPTGLAGLGSMIILQGFFGFRFYRQHKKSLQQRTQKFIESLKIDLGRIWEEELDVAISKLEGYGRELEAQIHVLSALRRTGRRTDS